MNNQTSWMAREISDTPSVVAAQASNVSAPLAALIARLHRHPPDVVVTCARGSSAHAATFCKHLIERYLALPVSEAAPNIASVYGRELKLRGQLVLAISQSGQSEDLVLFAKSATAAGATTVAVTNEPGAPLAQACEFILPIGAGMERSVAATKSFIATVAVLLRLIHRWADISELGTAIDRLPRRLTQSASLDWSAGVDNLAKARSAITIGRGSTLAIAREAALKLKETCNLYAEAFSAAEFLHGPVTLTARNYPILMFMPTDAALASMLKLATSLAARGPILLAGREGPPGSRHLPVPASDNPETDALCLIQGFYTMLLRLADQVGTDVDRPANLVKITSTI